MIALYTGIARTRFIIWDTLILVVINLILNYCLIFGRFGLPEMGIIGAAWASTIAEIVAFIVFLIYMIQQGAFKEFHLLSRWFPGWENIWSTFRISMPIVIQGALGIGSWFIFFSMIENIGLRELEMSNLIRNVYLILSIPCWGFSSGINTLVSNFIGHNNHDQVFGIIRQTVFMSVSLTLFIAIPTVLFPEYTFFPIFGSEDMSLLTDSQNLFFVLIGILTMFSIGGIILNGLIGTGATMVGLYINLVFVVLYLITAHIVINVLKLSLEWAWSIEIVYWLSISIVSILYLSSRRWHGLKV